ncbi:universal stress protein [Streptomyces antarcticus]|uniref:universal stress protein n=1 Tax=Streptomyces antarcticus TaxID=2996458 RepID=UPI00226E36BB|nr:MULTISPECIES: universal stress protein [unclassified Streptomyces]MCY0944531.1 universal stress protein [Streptomyces sp. H34-AA3]MCZ4084560.1 universal stress protein [Streptomyces sp. H34-S5]
MTNQVTVSLDGSGASTAAAHWAAREAELRNTALELVHATEWLEQPPLLLASTEIRGQWAENLLCETSDELRRLHPLLDITTREGAGPPSEALAAAARSSTMLVIGSRGLGSIAGFIVGSVGSATIAATEHPVVLVRSSGNAVAPADGLRTHGAVVAGVDTRQLCDKLFASPSKRQPTAGPPPPRAARLDSTADPELRARPRPRCSTGDGPRHHRLAAPPSAPTSDRSPTPYCITPPHRSPSWPTTERFRRSSASRPAQDRAARWGWG